MRCVLRVSVGFLFFCVGCVSDSEPPTGDPLDDAEVGQPEVGALDGDGDEEPDPSTDPDSGSDCHVDCFGGAFCEDGEVRVQVYAPVPCDVEFEHGTCVSEVITCAEGCVDDIQTVVAEYEAFYGRGWPERGDAPAPETLCAESALVQNGSPCADTDDCQPSLCDRLVCEGDVCVVPDGFVCDP